jgi:hypothetical protein
VVAVRSFHQPHYLIGIDQGGEAIPMSYVIVRFTLSNALSFGDFET